MKNKKIDTGLPIHILGMQRDELNEILSLVEVLVTRINNTSIIFTETENIALDTIEKKLCDELVDVEFSMLRSFNSQVKQKNSLPIKDESHTSLETWQKNLIREAYDRCWGLRVALFSEDIKIQQEAIKSLSKETGLRESFLIKNFYNIKVV